MGDDSRTEQQQEVPRQELIWLEPGVKTKAPAKQVPPVKVSFGLKDRPLRLWTLFRYRNKDKVPVLPFVPIHFKNAFLESFTHDWNVRERPEGNELRYFSRLTEGGVWVLLEWSP